MMEDQQRIDKLEKRVERLEQQQTEPIKITRIEIDTGEVRQRFDRIEQKQADHSERFDTLERHLQSVKQDIAALHNAFVGDFEQVERSIGEINATLSERFDTNKWTQVEHGKKLDEHGELLGAGPVFCLDGCKQ
jgi:chromosome segregation ATPase